MQNLSCMQDRLRMALRAREMTVTELSLNLNVSKASVSEWLSTGKIAFDHLVLLSIRLNVSVHWLLTGIGEMGLYGALHLSKDETSLLKRAKALSESLVVEEMHRFLSVLMQLQLGDNPMQQLMYQKILSDLACPLCVLDSRGAICDANLPFLQLLGMSSDHAKRVIGSHLVKWLPRGSMDYSLIFLQKLQESNDAEWFHGSLKNNEEESGWLAINALVKMRHFFGHTYFDCIFFPNK